MLALATSKVERVVRSAVLKPDHREQVLGALLHLLLAQPEASRAEADLVRDRRREDLVVRILVAVADLARELDGPLVFDDFTADLDVTLRGSKQAVEMLGHGGLAGAVLPDDGDEVSFHDLKIDFGDGYSTIGIGEAQSTCAKDGAHEESPAAANS